jgi:hypothetical protein
VAVLHDNHFLVVVMVPAVMAAMLDDDGARACRRDSENGGSNKTE